MSDRLKALIVDDEALARAVVREHLGSHPEIEILGECANGFDAVKAVHDQNPDLVFLDIQMPKLDGFEVLELLEPLPAVVFVPAYDQYALQAFDVHAIDYLLKPFDRDRFQKALRRARAHLRRGRETPADARLAALLAELKPASRKLERLAFKVDGRIIFVRLVDVDWVEADGNYVHLHTGQTSHVLRETMSWLEMQLPAERFMRISRSLIVNLDRIKELQPLFYGDYTVILQDGTRLSMSRNFRDRMEKLLERRS